MVTENMLRSYKEKKVFSENKNRIVDVTKCLLQIEIPNLLQMCATCSRQPSNISTINNYKPPFWFVFLE